MEQVDTAPRNEVKKVPQVVGDICEVMKGGVWLTLGEVAYLTEQLQLTRGPQTRFERFVDYILPGGYTYSDGLLYTKLEALRKEGRVVSRPNPQNVKINLYKLR